jgi:hypothetical protein
MTIERMARLMKAKRAADEASESLRLMIEHDRDHGPLSQPRSSAVESGCHAPRGRITCGRAARTARPGRANGTAPGLARASQHSLRTGPRP